MSNRHVDKVSRLSLGVALFFPFVYYPVAMLFWLGGSSSERVYKYVIAALAALQTFAALGLYFWQRRSG